MRGMLFTRTVDAATEQKYPVLLEYAKTSFERIKQRPPIFFCTARHEFRPFARFMTTAGRGSRAGVASSLKLCGRSTIAVSAIFWTRRSWAADVLAIEHRSLGVQKIMGYSKSNL